MDWFKRERGKAGIALAGMLLILVLMVWVPVSAAGVQETASGLATPVTGTVQVTPTTDATMTALSKEKLQQEIKQLQAQNDAQVTAWNKEKLQHENEWWWNYGATIFSSSFSALVLVSGGLIAFWRWHVDRRDAQDKDLKAQAEERFKTAVTVLGDEKEGTQVGGAILLRSFLNKDNKKSYERYYTQVFDLAVAYLGLPRTSPPSEDPDGILHSPEDPNAPWPLTPLRKALIAVFTEAFPLVRDERRDELRKERKEERFNPQLFNATGIRLDNAFLWQADLERVWMPEASLRKTDLTEAKLQGASLWRGHFTGAKLQEADLRKADLGQDDLSQANLYSAQLCGATLWGADLHEADLGNADLNKAIPNDAEPPLAGLRGVKLQEADPRKIKLDNTDLLLANLRKANLREAWLEEADLVLADLRGADLRGTHLHRADLSGADLSGADLSGADLSEAKLTGIWLNGARLQEDKDTTFDVSQVKFLECDINDVNQVKLLDRDTINWDDLRRGADCIWDNHIEVDADRDHQQEPNLLVDLHGANLSRADLRGADLNGVIYNIDAIQKKDEKGRPVKIEPTQWQGAQYNKKPVEEKEEKAGKVQPINDEQGTPVEIKPTRLPPGFAPDKRRLTVSDRAIIHVIKTHPPPSQSNDVQASLSHLLKRIHHLLIRVGVVPHPLEGSEL